MRVAIYNPYLHFMGGGEKYIAVLAQELSKYHSVDLFAHKSVDVVAFEQRLNVSLQNIRLLYLPEDRYPARVNNPPGYGRMASRFWRFCRLMSLEAGFSRGYDLLIHLTNTLPPRSVAKKSILVIQFPATKPRNGTYKNRSGRLKAAVKEDLVRAYRLRTYDVKVCYSNYVKGWIHRRWRIDADVVYPPIDVECFSATSKRPLILSVGRFFAPGYLHNKRQHFLILTFKELCDNGLVGWRLHLAGGIDDNPRDVEYLKSLYRMAEGYPIFFHPNVSFENLKRLYAACSIFWHATGYGADEEDAPEQMEHFGITTGEAMAAQCVPVVIKQGGQREIVRHGWDGFLWDTVEELKKYTLLLTEDQGIREQMAVRSNARSKDFSIKVFLERYWDLLQELMGRAI